MVTIIGISLISIIAVIIWAPFAFEIQWKELYRSSWFKWLINCLIAFACLCILFNVQPITVIPWVCSLILLSIVDIKSTSVRVYDLILMSGTIIPFLFTEALIPMLIMCGIFLALLTTLKMILKKIYRQDAFGAADIWVIISILIVFGGKPAILAIYIAIILSALVGCYLLFSKKKSRNDRLSFIPFLTLGIITTLFFSEKLLNIYADMIKI